MRSIVSEKPYPGAAAVLESRTQAGTLSSPRMEAWRQRLVNFILIFSDVLLAFVIWGTAYLVRTLWPPDYLPEIVGVGQLSGLMVVGVVPVVLVWVGLRAMQGLYPGYGIDEVEELRRQTYALLATLALGAIFALAFQLGSAISRFLLALVFVGLLFLSPIVRHFVKKWMMQHGVWGKPVVILGAGDVVTRLEGLLRQEWKLGFKPVAFFSSRLSGHLAEVREATEGRPNEKVLAEAAELRHKHRVDTLFLAMPHASREYMAELTELASVHFRNVVIIPDLAGVASSLVVARNLAGVFTVEIHHNLLDPWVRRFKRGLDVIGALVGGLLLSPLLVALTILVKLESSGPAFFGHQRLGVGDAHFFCWKFRTMHVDASRLLEEHLKHNPQLRAEWEQNYKLRDDPRVTRVGRFLRKTSLDELPQLWNVLRGEMSLVGPRPIVDAEVPKYEEVYTLYGRVKPGMSGFWQVGGRSDTSYEARVAMDAHYVRNWSIWLDLVILARTVGTVLAGGGAR